MKFELSAAQIRAARALLDWSLDDLAAATNVARNTIARIESGAVKPRDETLTQIRDAFESRDLQFLPNDGIVRHREMIDKLEGFEALNRLLDDVYETVKDGGSVCISGVNEKVFDKFYNDVYTPTHKTRMTAIKDKVKCRSLLKEGDFDFTYSSYFEYRWMPAGKFKENSFYVYNNKLAFIKFDADNIEIWRINMPSMAAAFHDLFDMVWDQCKVPPSRRTE